MKIDDILKKKLALQEQLDQLNKDIKEAKASVLEEISRYVKEFNISFIDMKELYDRANLSTALIQVAKVKVAAVPERKGYRYYNQKNGKWFNGYQKTIPKWFDLAKADSYLVAGASHTPMIAKALAQRGLTLNPVKTAYTEAQIKSWKDSADQLGKLYASKKYSLLETKAEALGADLERVLDYCNPALVDYLDM